MIDIDFLIQNIKVDDSFEQRNKVTDVWDKFIVIKVEKEGVLCKMNTTFTTFRTHYSWKDMHNHLNNDKFKCDKTSIEIRNKKISILL